MRHGGLSFPLQLFVRAQFPAWCTLACGVIASVALSFWAYRHEQRDEQASFERRAQSRGVDVQQGMTNAIDALQVVNQLFATNGSVSREQFHTFTQPLRARYPYIEAFSFHRLVAGDQRAAFEAQMRLLYPGFTIAEIIDGRRVVAAVKDRYRVIDYNEPRTGHEAAFGLDASSRPFQDAAIRRANDTGLPSATGLFRLFKGNGTQRGFLILMAVYRSGAALDDVASRRLAVLGHTVAVLHAADLIEKILAPSGTFGNAGLNIRVYAAASADESQLVYHERGTLTESQQELRPAWLLGSRPESFSRSFDVAGTTWHMVVSAEPTPLSATHANALLTLLMGLLTTFAATAYLRSVALRTQRIQQLVAQRTDELKQVNDLLIEDIKARKQAEQALVSSEEHARELADLSSDWFWEQDEHFRFISTDMTGKGGTPPPGILGATRWELSVDLDASDWPAHRAMLEAHQPFRNFEFKALIDGTPIRWISTSGKPIFDTNGRFKGYRGTSRNISDRKEAEEALRQSRSQLRKLADHQERVREDERTRIARDIHDELGQNLLALRLDVSMMAARTDVVTVTKEQSAAMLNQIDTTIKSVKAIINDLRPAVLNLGLHAAIEWQAKEFARRSGIACDLHIDHDEFAMDDKRATALFRILQELLTNIVRHAAASRVEIAIKRSDERFFMTIADDGIGLFAGSRTKENVFGMVGIEERIDALGGAFSIASDPGQGMAITVSIPI